MGNEESISSEEEHHNQPLQRTNSNSRSTFKNNVYAEIYDSAVSSVNEAASSFAQLDGVSQGLDLLSDAAQAVSEIAGQGIDVVATAFDDLIETLDEDEEGRPLSSSNPAREQIRVVDMDGIEEIRVEGEERSRVTSTTSTSMFVEEGDEMEEAHHTQPQRTNSQQNPLKSRSGYKNSIYVSLYESASATVSEAANAVGQFASQGIETVANTIDELMEEDPEEPQQQQQQQETREHREIDGEAVEKKSSSSSEAGEDVFQFVSELISNGVTEVANQIDYEAISNTILKAVQDINGVLGTELLVDNDLEEDIAPHDNNYKAVPQGEDDDEDLMDLPENPYLTAQKAAAAAGMTKEESETID